MAWSERFLRVINFTAAAESFSESVDALDTSIIDLVEELDASKENAQAVVFIMLHPRLIACLQAAFVLLLFTFYLAGIGDAPPAAAAPQQAAGRLFGGWARLLGLGQRFRGGAAADNDGNFPGAGIQGNGEGGARDGGDRGGELRARPMQPQLPPVPRAAAGALSKWLFLAVLGAGWVIYSKHSPEHQAEINARFQKGTKSFHRKVAFANLVDEASGPRPEYAPPRTPYDRRLPWPGADTFHNGLFVPRSDDIPMTTFAAAIDKAQGFAPDSDLSSQARSEASTLRQGSTVSVAVESLWATCVRVSNAIFGAADGRRRRRHHSNRDAASNSASNISSSGNDDSRNDASRYLVMPPSPQLPSASSLSSAEMATLRRASPQPELYCGKPVPTNKGKYSRKKRKGQQDRRGNDDDDDDDDEDRGLDRGSRKRALRGGSEQFTPQIANKVPVHGLVAEAFIAYERPSKNGAHLFRVDLDVQNRGLLTVQLVSAERRIVGDALPHPLDSRHPLHNKYLSRLLKRHLTETAEAKERKKQATEHAKNRRQHSSSNSILGERKRRYFSADDDDEDETDGNDNEEEETDALEADDADAVGDESDDSDDSSLSASAARRSSKKKAPKKSSNKMRDKSLGRGRLVKKSPRWREKRKQKRSQDNEGGDGRNDDEIIEDDEGENADDDEDDDDVQDNGGGVYASHEWTPAFSYSSLEPAGLGTLEESVIGPRFGGIGDQHTVAESNLTVSFVAVVPYPRAAFHGSLQFQVLRSNPHHVPLRQRFLARAHSIASERANNASLAALTEMERLAALAADASDRTAATEAASPTTTSSTAASADGTSAAPISDPTDAAASAASSAGDDMVTNDPRAAARAAAITEQKEHRSSEEHAPKERDQAKEKAKVRRLRVKQLAVAASAGARAYAEHMSAAADRAKAWYPQVGDWLSVPINRVAMLLEPGDTDDDDDDEEEEADIDVDDFLYGYCPGANGGGGGAFVPSEKWHKDRVADAAADVAVAQYWAGEAASQSAKLAWKHAQPHAFSNHCNHSNSSGNGGGDLSTSSSSSDSSSSSSSDSSSSSSSTSRSTSNRDSDQSNDDNGDYFGHGDMSGVVDEGETIFGPLHRSQRRNDLLYGGSRTAAVAAQRASKAAALGWSPAEIESGGLREVEAGGGESTGVAVGERVVVSARIRFEKLQVVDLPNDDDDEDEDEDEDEVDDGNDEEEEESVDERERTSSEDADTMINAEVSSDGSVQGDTASSSSNKRGTVGWFGDSATSQSAAVVNSEGANVAGSSTGAAAASNAADNGGAAAAHGSITSLYGVLRKVAQGSMTAVQGVLQRQPEDVMIGWLQASNALAPPLLWAMAGVLGDRPALAERATDLGYPTLAVEFGNNDTSSSKQQKRGRSRSSSSSERPHVKLEPRIAVCEGTCHNFECPLGKALFIGEALLGRTSREVCEHLASSRVDCVRDVTTAARDACSKQQETATMFSGEKEPNLSCRLCEGQDGVGGDPHFCENTFKYVNVSYACVAPEDLEELNYGPPMDKSFPQPKPPQRVKRQMFELTTNLQNMRNNPILVLAHRVTFTSLPSRLENDEEEEDHRRDDGDDANSDDESDSSSSSSLSTAPESESETDTFKEDNSAAKKQDESSTSFAGGREWFKAAEDDNEEEPLESSDESTRSVDADDEDDLASKSEGSNTASGTDSGNKQNKAGAATAAKRKPSRDHEPLVVVFEGVGVGGEMHFVGGRGDHNFGNPAEQVVLQADDEHKSSLLIKSLFDLPNHQGPWQVEVSYAVEAPHPLLSGLLPWLPTALRPKPRRIGTFRASSILSKRSDGNSKSGSDGGFGDVLSADNDENDGGNGGETGEGWLRGEIFETSVGPMRMHASGSP